MFEHICLLFLSLYIFIVKNMGNLCSSNEVLKDEQDTEIRENDPNYRKNILESLKEYQNKENKGFYYRLSKSEWHIPVAISEFSHPIPSMTSTYSPTFS